MQGKDPESSMYSRCQVYTPRTLKMQDTGKCAQVYKLLK